MYFPFPNHGNSSWQIDGCMPAAALPQVSARAVAQSRGSICLGTDGGAVERPRTSRKMTAPVSAAPAAGARPMRRMSANKQNTSSITHDFYGADAPSCKPAAPVPAKPLAEVDVKQQRNRIFGSHVLGAADKASTPVKGRAIRTGRSQQVTGITNALSWD